MQVPIDLVLDLTRLVTEHNAGRGLYAAPAELASACGDLARSWFHRRDRAEYRQELDENELVAWAERFGKHLGVFFLNERSL